jgi:cyclase
VVPGHGPVAGKAEVRDLKDYFIYIDKEVRARYDAGLTVEDAAAEISLDAFQGWLDAERIVMNVNALYKEYSGVAPVFDRIELFAMMSRYRKRVGIS